MNPLLELLEHGQSYWLDNLTRGKLRSGELARRVEEEGLRGVTSNPSIFHKAITEGEEYDDEIEALVREGLSVGEIYERLAVSDIREACDVLRPVYDDSGGADGFVSLEVSPYLAHDTEGSLEEARRLFRAVDRPNVFIKIPGAPAGVPAIEEALFEGINVNITLLFSIGSYEAVAEAYLRALERRREAGLPVDAVASVASFFLSRIDVLVDRLLGHRASTGGAAGKGASADGGLPQELFGRAALANAKLAYLRFLEILGSERWRALQADGAKVQRMLWASTSTKDPLYGDVRYVEPLIGPHTVNTLPDETIEAFADHGRVAETVEANAEEARRTMDALAGAGIDFDLVTAQLLDEGIQKFIDPFDRLMEALASRRARILGGCMADDEIRPGSLEVAWKDTLASLRQRQVARRLFAGDPTLWAADPGAVDALVWSLDGEREEAIRNRLGWLEAPVRFRERAEELVAFGREVRDEGTEDVLLLGMGGSSLSAEVAASVFGRAEGWPRLRVLDDTDPAAVRAVREAIDPARTLFLVASKSGTTAETLSFYRYFLRETEEALGEEAADRFVAITDPGTPLAAQARERGFRRTFENPADIGGRYSALSYFGLVPMALAGIDVAGLLDRALLLRGSCEPSVPPAANPGLRLGALLGLAGRRGRDKVTILASPRLASFGAWAEQLLAESTGKDGRGLLPVVGEPAWPAGRSGAPGGGGGAGGPGGGELPTGDRVFVGLRLADEEEGEIEAFLAEREAEGDPVVRIELDGLLELGAEFFRWEVATAVAGAILGVDPFDEPDVAESKRNTAELLGEWKERGGFPREGLAAAQGEVALYAPGAQPPGAQPPGDSLVDLLRDFLEEARSARYLALLPYFRPTSARERALGALRAELGEGLGIATTLGHGPRYLHSTGQLHKGGPEGGLFLLLTAEAEEDVPIPGEPYGFAVLQRAQALGDLRALTGRGRDVLRVHLESRVEEGLERLRGFVAEALRAPALETA